MSRTHGRYVADIRGMPRSRFPPFTPYVIALAATASILAGGVLYLVHNDKLRLIASRVEYLSVVADLKAESIRNFHRERLHDLNILVPGASGVKADLLLKPFTADQVCRRVRAALDGAAPLVA